MYRSITNAHPYLIAALGFVLGAAIASLVWMKIMFDTSNDAAVGYAVAYANLVEKAAQTSGSDSALPSWIWGVAQTYAGFAGEQYEDLSPRAREWLVESVARIDKLAPRFAPDSRSSVYTAIESATMRDCILAAKADKDAKVGPCVRALKPEIFGKAKLGTALTER